MLFFCVTVNRAAEADAFMSLTSESHSDGQSTLCRKSSVSPDSHPDFRAHGQQPALCGKSSVASELHPGFRSHGQPMLCCRKPSGAAKPPVFSQP